MTKSFEQLGREALKVWGKESQLDMVIEECAELIDAIEKWRRGRIDATQVLGEAVDIELMIQQLKLIIDIPVLWENVKLDKLTKLEKLLFPLPSHCSSK